MDLVTAKTRATVSKEQLSRTVKPYNRDMVFKLTKVSPLLDIKMPALIIKHTLVASMDSRPMPLLLLMAKVLSALDTKATLLLVNLDTMV